MGRERILLMGGWGAGKSTAIVDIARKLPGRMFVVDTTYEAERNFEGVEGVEIASVDGWDEYVTAMKKFRIKGVADDWLAIDRADPLWDRAQDAFIEKVFGVTADEWFVEYRKANEGGNPLAGAYGINWQVIKKMYGAFVDELMRFKGNVIVTTTVKQLNVPNRDGSGGDREEVRAEYQKWGVRPGGKDDMGFLFHTVLLMAEKEQGKWIMTTVRDRGREQMKMKPVRSFVEDYLKEVANWSITP